MNAQVYDLISKVSYGLAVFTFILFLLYAMKIKLWDLVLSISGIKAKRQIKSIKERDLDDKSLPNKYRKYLPSKKDTTLEINQISKSIKTDNLTTTNELSDNISTVQLRSLETVPLQSLKTDVLAERMDFEQKTDILEFHENVVNEISFRIIKDVSSIE